MPPGFRVQVFAAEPDVQNPIGMSWDARGRLWIAENYTYAERPTKFELGLRDRVVILADKDGDGQSDERKVFTDEVQMLTGLEVGRGGVWAICPPQLLFIPDANGDDTPDGPAQVQLDGFTVPPENYHNFANGLKWGPEGWLYGRCGASSPGKLGLPGTPEAERIPLNGGLWRFHPQRKTVEVLAHGTTNPWGHDWNEVGEPFFINTVNGHLWHAFTGAHFRRPHTQDPNPRVYSPMEMHADHWHWDTGKDWVDSRSAKGEHDRLGGGHAHSGCMIYLADNWPEEYRDRLFTLNLHGRRMNEDRLEREGSGYVARHEPDLFQAADPWFRGIELSYGPDGGVYVLDWSDTGECHENTGVHRLSGRIYKITYGEPRKFVPPDLTRFSAAELVELHRHSNEWYVRQARQELIRRVESEKEVETARTSLRSMYDQEESAVHKLRALWTLFAIGGTDAEFLQNQLKNRNEHIRAWAIRLLTDDWPLDSIFSKRPATQDDSERDSAFLLDLATNDPSSFVRLTLASTLQRLPYKQRPQLAAVLCSHADDAGDHNLPLLIWYGLIPVADNNSQALVDIAEKAQLPLVRKFATRRLAEDLEKTPSLVNALVKFAAAGSPELQADVLDGLAEGLAGWRKAPAPAAWSELQTALAKSESPALQARMRELSVLFGDGRALDDVKKIARDGKADLSTRRAALDTLIVSRPDDLREICESLLNVRFLNTTAVKGLARFDDPAIGEKLAKNYRSFHPSERSAVIETLVARPSFAKVLLEQIAEGKIARTDLSPFQARQIRSFDDPELTKTLASAWGEIRDSAADKQAAIATLKTRLDADTLKAADLGNGRLVYQTTCATCHRLYGHGGVIGPDLTGAGRHNLDYLLENMLDPSAVVNAEFRVSVVVLEDGRVLNGMVAAQTERTVTLQTAKERLTLERKDIDMLEPSKQSLMPEGQLQNLSPVQVRDLFAYLMHPVQVPLPPGAEKSQGTSP